MTKRQVQDSVYLDPFVKSGAVAYSGELGKLVRRWFIQGPFIRSWHNFGDLEGKIKSQLTLIHN